ncbi:hypothetical protein AB0C29_26635 [Actinoplanes sp. NPDC048791]|uniref:hypothetical protein n=1 Tax=Actinoplanes sp. NPDC048791 TaxID=3154623 RepID=UPI0033E1A39C
MARPEAPNADTATSEPGPVPPVPPPDDRPGGPPDAGELTRLREEVSALHAKLDTRQRRSSAVGTLRRVVAAVLIAVTAFALAGSVVGVWAARTAMNTDRWVATVAPLPQNPQVSAAVADYATIQVFEAVDVEQRLRTVLPPQAAFVAGPVADQLAGKIREITTTVLRSDRFQSIWVELNRRAHVRAVAIINGSSDVVLARDNRVEIDLLPLINQVLRVLSAQLPTLFGKQLTLPDLNSGAIPVDLRDRVQETLGVTLPPNFAQFTVYDSGQLRAAQQAVAAAKRDLVLVVVATIVLLLIALAVSPVRRRTLLQLGLWLVVAAVAITAVLRAVRTQVLQEVPAGLYRDGVAAAFNVVFAQLRTRGTQLIWLGVLLAVVMYLIGPARGPRWLRHAVVTGGRAAGRGTSRGAHALGRYGPGWAGRHLDALRVGGLVAGALLALLLSSWTSLLVIAVLLAVYEVLVTLVGKSATTHLG